MSRSTTTTKIPRPVADDQWVCLTQALPTTLKKLPKTLPGENASMTVQELQNLRSRIEDLRKLNDQLIFHRLPALQHVVDGLFVISTTQHQQLKLALASGGEEDDGELLEEVNLSPEQQVQLAFRKAEDASYRFHKAKERFDGITSQFEEYGEKTRELMRELTVQQEELSNVRENSKLLVKEIVQTQNEMAQLEKSQRELTNKHQSIEATVSTLTTQLAIGNEQLINESTARHQNITQLTRSTGGLETDITRLQELLKGLISTISQRQGVIIHLDDEIEKLSSLEQKCEEYKLTKMNNVNELNQLKAKEEQTNITIQSYTTQTQQLDIEIKKTQMEQASRVNRITEAKGEVEKLENIVVEDLRSITSLKSTLSDLTTSYHDSISSLTASNNATQKELEGEVGALKAEMNDQQEQYDRVYALNQREGDHQVMTLLKTSNLHQGKLDNLEGTKSEVQHQLNECAQKIEMLRNDIITYQSQQENKSNVIQQRFLELQQISIDLEAEEEFLRQRKLTQSAKRKEFELQNSEFISQDVYRRKLHNTLQDLKGNIRVLCRIRPNLPHDNNGSGGGQPPLQHHNGSNELKLTVREKEHKYQFETIFGQNSTQEDVFTEVQEVVQSAIDGYEVCLFSYGQTGSGKSHTMTGSLDHPTNKGIIPRSVDLIFQNVTDLKAHSPGWDIKLSVSCIQIYLDKISDLLTTEKQTNTPQDLKLSNDQVNKKINVHNLTFRPVPTAQHVYKALEDAQRLRVVAATGMNATSSRSHFVFTLHIEMHNKELNQHRTGVLNLCDLAGSERVSSAQTTGDQLKETQKINSSLSTLNRVFMELAENRDHIPFRETKLTELLQYCLSGDGKTLMIVNLSPAFASAQETNGSLQLASTVARVQRGGRGQAKANSANNTAISMRNGGNGNAAISTRSATSSSTVAPTPMSQASVRSGFGAAGARRKL